MESLPLSHSGEHLPEVIESTKYQSYDYDHYQTLPHTLSRTSRENPTSPPLSMQQSQRLVSAQSRYSELDAAPIYTSENHSGKEVVPRQSTVFAYPDDPESISKPPLEPQPRTIYGIPKRGFLILAGLVIFAAVAVGVACGVVFGRKHTSSGISATTKDPRYDIGGDLNPSYYSTTGAFNGSGVAVASATFNDEPNLYLYYQDWTGNIMATILQADGSWTDSNVVANDARNGTPISAVAFIVDNVANEHIFYIDQDSIVRQKVSTNATLGLENIWGDGPLNELNLKADEPDSIGLQACWWGDFYGDSDNSFDNPFKPGNPKQRTGMHLWYADTNTSFQQYSWVSGVNEWSNDEHEWKNMNGRAGVGCQTWLSGNVSYVFMANLENVVEIWWKDSDDSQKPSSTHPINEWVKAPIEIPNVHPSSSLGYTDFLVVQSADETIQGYNISWAVENTSFVTNWPPGTTGDDKWTISDPSGNPVEAIPGTHFSITTLQNDSGGKRLVVFFQAEGDDITLYTRDDIAGSWSSSQAPIGSG